jgi:hypothetical protein
VRVAPFVCAASCVCGGGGLRDVEASERAKQRGEKWGPACRGGGCGHGRTGPGVERAGEPRRAWRRACVECAARGAGDGKGEKRTSRGSGDEGGGDFYTKR